MFRRVVPIFLSTALLLAVAWPAVAASDDATPNGTVRLVTDPDVLAKSRTTDTAKYVRLMADDLRKLIAASAADQPLPELATDRETLVEKNGELLMRLGARHLHFSFVAGSGEAPACRDLGTVKHGPLQPASDDDAWPEQ